MESDRDYLQRMAATLGPDTGRCPDNVEQRHARLIPDVLKPGAPGNPKDAAGAAKPQMGLIPAGAMETVARVMELGAKKYGPYNWRSAPVKKMVYAHAALRHLFAWIGGQTLDPESGYSHLAHVASCMLIILDAEAHGKAIEDRTWLSQQKESN